MSFLSAGFLFALPLLAVPIVIHLYRGRQRDVIPWGAMQFLASAATRGRRMERLEQLALLALRVATVAALVFALARPVVRSHWFSRSADQHLVLVVDDSLSMSRQVEGRSAFAQLTRDAINLIDSLPNSAAVQILLAAGGEWATTDDIVADAVGKRQLRELIEQAEPTEGSANLLERLQTAVHLEPNDDVASRRIVVFTDCQAKSWNIEAEGAWRQLAASRQTARVPTSIEVVDCGLGTSEIDNLAVTGISAARLLVQPGAHAELAAELTNFGDLASEPMNVQWLVDGKTALEAPIEPLAPQTKRRVAASLRLADAGLVTVVCRLDAVDQASLDQQSSVVIEVADQLSVLFVHSDGRPGATVSEIDLFAAALGYERDAAQDWHSIYRPDVVSQDQLATHPLTNYRAIVVDNITALERSTFDRLEEFVRAGGGLWLTLGDQTAPELFNRELFADGAGLSPLPISTLEVIRRSDDPAATIHPPSREHAATMQLANTTQLDIDDARIEQRWTFGDPAADQEKVSVLLEAGNGRPLVVENYVGQGRVLVQAFPLGLQWSNLPLLKAYVVMIRDWLDHLTAPTTARYNLAPGALLSAVAPADAPEAAAELVTPRGRTIPLIPVGDSLGRAFRYTQTRLPGAYRMRFTSHGELVGEAPFYVSRDATESDFRSIDDNQRRQIETLAGVQFAAAAVQSAAVEAAPTRREPLWGALLAGLVGLLALELTTASLLARRRYGEVVNPIGTSGA